MKVSPLLSPVKKEAISLMFSYCSKIHIYMGGCVGGYMIYRMLQAIGIVRKKVVFLGGDTFGDSF